MDAPPLNQQELAQVYTWIDQLHLSRPKKNITRDFSDGVLMAEVISHYFPKLLHHRPIKNLQTGTLLTVPILSNVTEKVLKKLNYQISKNDIDHIITNTPDIIQRVLKATQSKLKAFIEKSKNLPSQQKSEVSRQAQFKKISQNQELKQLLMDKDNTIKELKDTIEIFQLKISKMQQLIKVKDSKIQSLVTKLQQAGVV